MPIAHFVPGGAASTVLMILLVEPRYVGQLEHFARAFGMDQDLDARMLLAEQLDVLGAEHLVDAAVALPEDHFAAARAALRVLPPSSSAYGSQTGIWSSVMPIA